MNKLFSKIIGASLAIAMMIGVGAGINAAKQAKEVNAADNDISISETPTGTSYTGTNFTISSGGATNSNYYKLGSATFTSKNSYSINSTKAISYSITTRKFGGPSASEAVVNLSLMNGSNVVGTASYSPTNTNLNAYTGTFNVTGDTSNVKFVIKGNGTSGGGKGVGISAISFTATSASGNEPTLESIAISGSMTKTTYIANENWDPSGLVVTGTYDNDETSNLTTVATFAYYNDSAMTNAVANPNALGTGANQQIYVKATVSGISNGIGYEQTVNVNPVTYTVTYHDTNKTSGSVPTDNNAYESGQTVTVAANTGNLIRDGYTWSGWSINQDGSGTAYGPTPYTPTYTVGENNIDFYPIWTKNITPLPEHGTITISGTKPSNFGGYGTDVQYVTEEDNTPDSEFGFVCTNVMKATSPNLGKLQFKKGSGVLYSTTPLSYIRSVSVGGSDSSEAIITYGTSANSGCTSTTVGTESTYFKIANGNNVTGWWTITITYSLQAPSVLTGLSIESGLDTVRKTYDDGESFDPTGLVVRAEWNNVIDTEVDVLDSVVWTPTVLTAGTTEVTGTYTHGDEHETVTVSGLTVKAPDAVLDGSSNVPAGVASSTNTNVGEGKINDSGVKYGYYALQTYNSNLEFNQNTNGAYIGNNESFGKYIRKIVVTLGNNYFNRVTMYKGDSPIPSETAVSPDGSNNKRTYNFGDDSEYFALKQTQTGNWTVITKIEIFLGSLSPVVDTVSASMTNETRYAGQALSASDFEVTVTWTQGKEDTHPTDDFTWTVNGQLNGTLNEGDNSVVVTYAGVSSEPINVVGAHPNAKDVIEDTITTSSSLAYHYSKSENTTVDTLTRELTGVSGSGYVSWSNKTNESDAIYAGQSAGGTNESGATIQLRTNNNNSGIITTKTGGLIKKVTVNWNSYTTDNRKLDVYGKNSAYTSPEDLYSNSSSTLGTMLGSIEKGVSTELVIEGNYSYIGLRSSNSAIYIDSIEIEWADISYAYSNISMRFGGSISKDLWNELDTDEHLIAGVGVMITGYDEQLRTPYSIKDHAAEAVPSTEEHNINTQVVDYYVALSSLQAMPEKNNEYYWNLKYSIDSIDDMLDAYTAAAYIKLTNGELVFLKQVKYSVWSLAKDYLDNRNCDEETAGGSLYNLVNNMGLE